MAEHFNIEAEWSVIGAIVNFGDKLAEVSDRLKPEHFYQGWCREVYRIALELARKGTPVDLVSVYDAVKASDMVIDGGDPLPTITEAMANCPSAANVKTYAEIVMRHADNRRKLALCNEIAEAVNEKDAAKESAARVKLATFAPSFTSAGSRLMPSFGFEGWDNVTNWLIDGLVPAESFGIVYGPSGSFKSFQVLDWAASVATGKPWMGQAVEQGLCIYVAAEGAGAFRKRVKGWADMHNGGQPMDNLAVIGVSVDLTDASQVDELIGVINQTGVARGMPVRMVVFDTLARCFNGDENSAKEMGMAISECDRIKEATGATVLAVHHSGKDADKGARGSSALRGACDFEFMVKREGEDNTYSLKHTKAKDSEQMRSMTIPLSVVEVGMVSSKVETTLVRSSEFDSVQEAMSVNKTGGAAISYTIIEILEERPSQEECWTTLRKAVKARLNLDPDNRSVDKAISRAVEKMIEQGQLEGAARGNEVIKLI